ncbi:MAG: hypothetical protein R6U58_06885 [Bacteroidales bacterium]
MVPENNIEKETGGKTNKNPFSVPEGYFDSFPAKMMNRLEAEKPVTVSLKERIWEALRPQLALAAAITGFALIGYLGFRSFIQTDQDWLSDEQITEYINHYEHEFSDYYLLSLLEENEFYFDYEADTDLNLYFDDPDMYIEYLYQDDIDVDLIYDEL